MKEIDPKVEEAVETLELGTITRRRLLSGAGLASASLAASALLAACSSKKTASAASGHGNFPSTPNWKFVFVNHVTTNPFFTPTQYGADDASKLLGTTYQWTGSKDSIVSEMVNATPGQLNIQPRIDGAAQAIKSSGKSINFASVATNADVTKGTSIIDAYVQGHQSNLAGLLAVD